MTTLDSPGICLTCGTGIDGVEPDARHYSCNSRVFSAREVLPIIA